MDFYVVCSLPAKLVLAPRFLKIVVVIMASQSATCHKTCG